MSWDELESGWGGTEEPEPGGAAAGAAAGGPTEADAANPQPFEAGGLDAAGLAPEDTLQRWPFDWRALYPRERWIWFTRLWVDVCALRERYRLPVRSRWWEDSIQVEALAATAAWVDRYDSGEWDDPPGKLALLLELERLHLLLRDGREPFHPGRDRPAFDRHLLEIGCQPPPGASPGASMG